MGPTLATEILLRSRLGEQFELIHLDTSDHRDLTKLGAIDFQNIYLALKHYWQLFWMIITRWPKLVYIPVSQATLGYLRDSVFILIALLFGRKVVCHLRGGNFRDWLESTSAPMRGYVRLVHSFVDGQIVLGERLRNLFEGILPPDRLFVVPNGRNFESFDRPVGQPRHRITVLYLANFMREKGVLDALYAIPEVIQACPNVVFRFAGNWMEPAVKQEFEEFMRLHPDLPIEVIGPVTGVAKHEVLRNADIFVFPSYYPPEGHPWVLVEAMAAGLPVISTDQGAIAEYVLSGVNGFIVEKHNSSQVAARIVLLASDARKREQMGRASRKLYEENLTETQLVDRMAYAFHKVLAD
jgi:glycosyltransferase involved in cell wall biosynthesis